MRMATGWVFSAWRVEFLGGVYDFFLLRSVFESLIFGTTVASRAV